MFYMVIIITIMRKSHSMKYVPVRDFEIKPVSSFPVASVTSCHKYNGLHTLFALI